MVQLNDPNQREHILQKVNENVVTVEDENGEVFRIVKCVDFAVPKGILFGRGSSMGITVQYLREIEVRNDDIFICDYSKTGKLIIC